MWTFHVNFSSNLSPKYLAVGFQGTMVLLTVMTSLLFGLVCFWEKCISWDLSGLICSFELLDQSVIWLIAFLR